MVADEAAQLGVPLVPAGGVAPNGSIEASCPSFPDAPVSVNEEAVRDIGPALLRSGVKCVELPKERRNRIRRVVVRRRAVMDEKEPGVPV